MKKEKNHEFSRENVKAYMKLPVKEKLARLQQMNNFFDRLMPDENKKIWKKLREKGF